MVVKIENTIVESRNGVNIYKISAQVDKWKGMDKKEALDPSAFNEQKQNTRASVWHRAEELTREYQAAGLKGKYEFVDEQVLHTDRKEEGYYITAVPYFKFCSDATSLRRDGSELITDSKTDPVISTEVIPKLSEATVPVDGDKVLLLEFDGVIHSYISGWQGVAKVLDPIMPGAANFLYEATKRFDVQIYSSRSDSEQGLEAMQEWLKDRLAEELGSLWYQVFRSIKWPKTKPPAWLSIDDRAIQFTGEFPRLNDISSFTPYRHGFDKPKSEA